MIDHYHAPGTSLFPFMVAIAAASVTLRAQER